MPEDLTEHAARNQAAWAKEAPSYVPGAERNWATDEITWGILDVPGGGAPDARRRRREGRGRARLRDRVRLGVARAARRAGRRRRPDRGAARDRPARCRPEHGLEFPLVHASAEDVPLPDASFDLAVSEYGASIWCDPDLWIAEAARLLRPGGELVFLVNGTFLMLTSPDVDPVQPAGTELLRPYFGMRRFEWVDDDVDRLPPRLRRLDPRARRRTASRSSGWSSCGNPGRDAAGTTCSPPEWAERWPAEEMWKARKVA